MLTYNIHDFVILVCTLNSYNLATLANNKYHPKIDDESQWMQYIIPRYYQEQFIHNKRWLKEYGFSVINN